MNLRTLATTLLTSALLLIHTPDVWAAVAMDGCAYKVAGTTLRRRPTVTFYPWTSTDPDAAEAQVSDKVKGFTNAQFLVKWIVPQSMPDDAVACSYTEGHWYCGSSEGSNRLSATEGSFYHSFSNTGDYRVYPAFIVPSQGNAVYYCRSLAASGTYVNPKIMIYQHMSATGSIIGTHSVQGGQASQTLTIKPEGWTASTQIADYRWQRNESYELNDITDICPKDTVRGYYVFSGKRYGPVDYYPTYNDEPAWDRLYRADDRSVDTLTIVPPSCGSATLEITDIDLYARHSVATSDQPSGPPETGDDTLVAEFVYTRFDSYAPNHVEFHDRSTIPDGCTPYYAWYFDYAHDQAIDSTEANPTRVYSDAGSYSVRLVVSCGSLSDDRFRTLAVQARESASCAGPSQPVITRLVKVACVDPDTGEIISTPATDASDGSLLSSAIRFFQRLFGLVGNEEAVCSGS